MKGATKGSWKQKDAERAIAAAEQAGLKSYRIEIAPDGTIAIVVGEMAKPRPPEEPRSRPGD